MKKYLKNLAVLLAFLLVQGLCEKLPEKYFEQQRNEFYKDHPDFAVNAPFSVKDFKSFVQQRPLSESVQLENMAKKQKTILIFASILQWFFILLFGWFFTAANKCIPKEP